MQLELVKQKRFKCYPKYNLVKKTGPDHNKTVYIGMSAVHCFELEGIVGTLNLISILETGKDFRGKEWPEINAVAEKLDRMNQRRAQFRSHHAGT